MGKWSPFDWLRKPLGWLAWRMIEWSCGLNTKYYYYKLVPTRKEVYKITKSEDNK